MSSFTNLGDLIRRDRDPEKVAVIDLGGEQVPRKFTYARLDAMANGVARALARRGFARGERMAILSANRAEYLAAYFGIMRAGCVAVPVSFKFPRRDIHFILQDAGARLVFCDGARRGDVPVDLPQVQFGNQGDGGFDDFLDPGPFDAVGPRPREPAMFLYTSGSTGQPKGVGVEHRAVTNLLASFRRALGLGSDDRWVAVTTLSFDISILELLLPALCGADLVIATADETREPDRLRSLIERTGATAMQATPQTWRLLESAGGVPAGLRLRLSGGETLPADLAGRLMAPGVTLWNLYGPTETTVYSAGGVVTGAADAAVIGPPVEHTRVYVLDERLMPVPAGVVGEVCLAGRGVARGYLGQPRLTARSFRPDPWGDEPGARLYRTGDLGRWREGGGLELIGRNDNQVKIRGFRVECGEIEAVLRAHRDVRQAAVAAVARAGELALVAYIVPRRGSAAAQPGTDLLEELRPHLRAALPDYMIPALVVTLPALPLTPNAKVDRSALPAPRWGATPAAGHVQPRNEVEAALAGIWSDLLATEEPVGVHDNLFAAGGHSLTATRFAARVGDAYGVSLPVHQVFASPTIAELAEVISADPDFGLVTGSPRHAELDALSDDDLDELLRAALAQRSRRRANNGGPDS
jgi:amino acid adenylation domain-containing protein